MGVMKMGNIVPRVGLEPTYLAFWASVLSLHHIGPLISPLYACSPVYVALSLRGQSADYFIYIYIYIYIYMHRSAPPSGDKDSHITGMT